MIDFKSLVEESRDKIFDVAKLKGFIKRAEDSISESIKKNPTHSSWNYNIVLSSDVALKTAYETIKKLELDKTTNLDIDMERSYEIGPNYIEPTLKFSYKYKDK